MTGPLLSARRAAAGLLDAIQALSPVFVIVVAGIVITALTSSNFYLLEILVLAVIYMQFTSSWDVLCGYANQDNFGIAFFTGISGYIAAILNKSLAMSPWLTVPISATAAAAAGLVIGWLALRLRGPYFALLTIVFAAVLSKLAYIFSHVTGGEEGISGIASFSRSVETDLLVCVTLLFISVLCMTAFARSHYGLILRSTQHNEDAALASGINAAHYKVAGFGVSAFFAGVGGAMFAHTHMQVSPELMAGSLSVLVVLMAVAGGRGTILGPVLAAGALTLFNEWLRIIEIYRPIIFTGTLIVMIYIFPSGIANAAFFARAPVLRRLLFGREA